MVNVNRPTVNAVSNNPYGGYGGGVAGYRGYGGYGGYGYRGYGGYGGYGLSTPFSNYYGGNWYQGNWPWYQAPVGLATGAALGWLGGTGSDTYVYSNPYYAAPPADVPAQLNYTQPLVIQAPAVSAPPAEINIALSDNTTATPTLTPSPPPPPEPPKDDIPADPAVREAMARLDEARTAFTRGEYAKAQEVIEQGIQKAPGDATLHEFRALTMFAQKKYADAAGTVYAVLSAGPGWNWETLRSFYDNEETYKDQLRALEDHSRANPKAGDDHFLLAYHYLVLDAKDAAVKQLEQVVQIMPKDQLAAALLKALKQSPPDDRPQPKP